MPGLSLTSPASQARPTCLDGSTEVARAVKKITVVVRDGANPTKTYIRETSTFDEAT